MGKSYWSVIGLALAFLGQACAQDKVASNGGKCLEGVRIELGGFRVGTKSLDLRYQIRNGIDRDIWVCEIGSAPGARPETFLGDDDQTLVLRRLVVAPPMRHVYYWGRVSYVRLKPGEIRPEEVSLDVPVWPGYIYGRRDMRIGSEIATRLLLEIGYYERIPDYALDRGAVDHNNLATRFWIEYRETGNYSDQQAARMVIDGIHVPYVESALPYMADDPNSAAWLFPKPSPIEALEGYFNNFSISLDDYQYACRLFGIPRNLYAPAACEIEHAYLQVAEEKRSPSELPMLLNRCQAWKAREAVLDRLATAQQKAPKTQRPKPPEATGSAAHPGPTKPDQGGRPRKAN